MPATSRYIVTLRDVARVNGETTLMFDHGHGPRGRRSEREPRTHLGPGFWMRQVFDPLRGGRAAVRRGDVRVAILRALRDKPMHGYQVIQELEAQTAGRWRPSAGSVYPTLQQLEDEGLVRSSEVEGRRTYDLTDAGRTAANLSAPDHGPWAHAHERRDRSVQALALQVAGAAMQVNRMGSPASIDKAKDILVDSRRRLYRLLSEDDMESAADANVEETETGSGES